MVAADRVAVVPSSTRDAAVGMVAVPQADAAEDAAVDVPLLLQARLSFKKIQTGHNLLPATFYANNRSLVGMALSVRQLIRSERTTAGLHIEHSQDACDSEASPTTPKPTGCRSVGFLCAVPVGANRTLN